MEVKDVVQLYFSPTGTTKKIIKAITRGMGVKSSITIDLTTPDIRKSRPPHLPPESVVIAGVPVYGERIPQLVIPYFKKIKGDGQPVILVSVYGNVGEGIALKQLYSIFSGANFKVAGGASFIGEHSFSSNEIKIGAGRPDQSDLEKAVNFGGMIADKIWNIGQNQDYLQSYEKISFPDEIPLIAKILPDNSARLFTRVPEVDRDRCNKCGLCYSSCPVGVINKESLEINEAECLRCFACVKKCPGNARAIRYKNKWLVKQFFKMKGKEKEPVYYI